MADDSTTQEGQAQGGTPEASSSGGEDLTALKAAIAKEREGRKAAEKEAKRVAELEAELAKFREATKSEAEKAVEQARKEGRAEAAAELTRQRVLDKIEVRAARKFADPEDAQLRLAGRADEFVGPDGQIDAAGIDAALTKLLEEKPHLAANGGRRFAAGADGGPRGESTPADKTPRGLISAGLRANGTK